MRVRISEKMRVWIDYLIRTNGRVDARQRAGHRVAAARGNVLTVFSFLYKGGGIKTGAGFHEG